MVRLRKTAGNRKNSTGTGVDTGTIFYKKNQIVSQSFLKF